jgi:predicted Zn-dependent protease
MAPRPPERHKLSKAQKNKRIKSTPSPKALLASTIQYLQTGNPNEALRSATQALSILDQRTSKEGSDRLLALSLLGEINIELGETGVARRWFLKAVDIDPEGEVPEEQGGGAEKFLWLAQLSEEGGEDSVRWFEKGAKVLRQQFESEELNEEDKEEKRQKLASALCGIAEVYMTDLSWDDKEAESQCDAVMAEALTVAPESVEVLQTLASVRISQLRRDEAREHLEKSLSLWKGLEPEDLRVPAFPTRISLARLLMEAEMEEETMEVLERLVSEDDQSVEAWYLGGWCQYVQAEKRKNQMNGDAGEESIKEMGAILHRSRKWLLQCLRLYNLLGYQDERLKEHADELIQSLNSVLGEPADDATAEDDDEWEDADESEDEVMDGA